MNSGSPAEAAAAVDDALRLLRLAAGIVSPEAAELLVDAEAALLDARDALEPAE